MKAPVRGAWRRLAGRRGSAGTTEAGLALMVAALVVGALVGTGLAATDVVTSDGLTWLDDGTRGTVVQVDPTTGQPQTELKVAPPGHLLEIAQRDGLLVVRDTVTGMVTIIDVAMLAANGRLAAGTGTDTKILLDADQLYLVDRPSGTIRRIDPSTAADRGTAWSRGIGLIDVAIDGTGTVWALTIDGQLHALRWSDQTVTLVDAAPVRHVGGTGSRSVLVTHDEGVTVLAPESSKVVRVGTEGGDTTIPAPQLSDQTGQVGAPAESPADLVPATVPSSATVLIVHGDRVLSVDVGQYGCPHPGRPVVFHNRVYVPCLGSGKVLVLNAEGRRQPPDILVPNGDAKLTVDDGRLVIYVPGTEVGVVVDADGSTRPIRTHDDNVPPRDPNVRRTPPPMPTTSTPRRTPPPNSNQPPNLNPPGTATPTPTPTPTPTGTTTTPVGPTGRADPPTNVGAQARPDGTVLVTWDPGGQAGEYHIYRGDSLTEIASVAGAATSAVVTTLAPGTDTTVFVEAWYGDRRVRSALSGPVHVYTYPAAPSRVDITVASVTASTLFIDVTWPAANDNGSPIDHYSVSISTDKSFSRNLNVTGLASGRVAVDCEGTCDNLRINASVFGVSAAGNGTPVGGSVVYWPQGAPVITSFSCLDEAGNEEYVCRVEFTGTGSIQWTLSGSELAVGVTEVWVGCGIRSNPIVVTITNGAGSATRSGRIPRCRIERDPPGPIP